MKRILSIAEYVLRTLNMQSLKTLLIKVVLMLLLLHKT